MPADLPFTQLAIIPQVILPSSLPPCAAGGAALDCLRRLLPLRPDAPLLARRMMMSPVRSLVSLMVFWMRLTLFLPVLRKMRTTWCPTSKMVTRLQPMHSPIMPPMLATNLHSFTRLVRASSSYLFED